MATTRTIPTRYVGLSKAGLVNNFNHVKSNIEEELRLLGPAASPETHKIATAIHALEAQQKWTKLQICDQFDRLHTLAYSFRQLARIDKERG